MLFYKVGPSPNKWWGMLTTSFDRGKSWDQAHRLPDGIYGPIKNKPIELSDGDIICPSSEEKQSKPRKPSQWRVHFERTRDLGKTWERGSPINSGRTIQAIQPSILSFGNSRLLAIGRTQQNRLFEIVSKDNGKTWGAMTLGNLPNPNSGTDALTLKDGRHILIYNHAAGYPNKWGGPRTPLNLAISKDGRKWVPSLILENGAGEYSYPAVIQTSDGLVHITYTWNRKRIRHVVIDPVRLAQGPHNTN
jgi:predicted neuraminidase